MTRRIKGLQFAAVVLVLIGICFGTAHSQSTCTLTYDDINQSSMEHLGGSAETVLQITAEEWEEAVQSEFFQCICSLLDQLGSQTIDSEAFFNEFQSCLVFPPVTVEFILTVDPATIDEDGGSAVLTVSTSHGDGYFGNDRTITLSLGGSANRGTDYILHDDELIFRNGQTSVSTRLDAVNDGTKEMDETVMITATYVSYFVLTCQAVGCPDGTETSAGTETITIIDGMPQFTLTVDTTAIDEDEGSATVTVSTGGVTFQTDQTITLSLAGTATDGEDYAVTQDLILEAGQTSVSTSVTAIGDTVPEGSETIVISAQYDGEMIGETQTVTIIDGMPQFTLTVDTTAIDEDEGSATVTVSTGGVTFQTDQTITLSLAGTATDGEDYAVTQDLILEAGQTSVSTSVTAIGDTVPEGSETIVISAQYDGEMIGETQTVTIIDGMPQFTLTVDTTAIDEDEGSATVTVSTGGVTFQTDQTITLSLAGTATDGEDYAVTQDLILEAGQTSVSTSVTAIGDTVPEGSETIVISAQYDGEMIGETQTVTIIDGMPQFTLTVDTTAIDEDEGSATVTVSTGGVTFQTDQTITLSLAGTATEGEDYAVTKELTLTAGQTSVSTTVTARDDTVPEGSETIEITAQHAGEIVGGTQTVTIMEPASPLPTKEVVEETLEAVVTSTLSNVTTNIGTRFSAARGGTAFTVAGRPIPFAESALALAAFHDHSDSALYNGHDSDRRGRDLDLSRLLETSAFQVSLLAADENTQGAEPAQSLTVWGRVDRMFFDKESGDINRYGGDLKAGYLGIDTWLDDRWLIGVAASVTMVEADYGLSGAGGELGLTMLGVYPYLRLALDDLSELWVILGVSKGEITNLSETGSAPEESNIIMYMFAAGTRRELTTIGGIDIALLGDAGFGSLRSDGRSGLQVIDNLSTDTWRARLGFSGSHTILLADQATFTPFVEVMGRYDAGDDNVGVEISGGIQYANPASGLGLEMRANILPLYSESDYREYGFSLSVSASPGAGGEGLAMAISTSLGPETGNVAGLSSKDLFASAHPAVNLSEMLSINGEVGYGFPVVGARGVLTPFGQFRVRNDGGRQMHAGVRLGRMTSATPWNLELSGGQRTSEASDPEYLVSLLGRVRF